MRRTLLLLAAIAVMVFVLASTAWAEQHDLPATGGPALLPIGAAAVAASLGVSAGIAYLRRRKH
jgi:LPXTG-motif cell wall-anchored protein